MTKDGMQVEEHMSRERAYKHIFLSWLQVRHGFVIFFCGGGQVNKNVIDSKNIKP